LPPLALCLVHRFVEESALLSAFSVSSTFIGPEVNLIIYYDVTSGKFRSFLPSFPEASLVNIEVVGGMGLIVLMKVPKSVTFKGAQWVGELP